MGAFALFDCYEAYFTLNNGHVFHMEFGTNVKVTPPPRDDSSDPNGHEDDNAHTWHDGDDDDDDNDGGHGGAAAKKKTSAKKPATKKSDKKSYYFSPSNSLHTIFTTNNSGPKIARFGQNSNLPDFGRVIHEKSLSEQLAKMEKAEKENKDTKQKPTEKSN